MKLPVLTERYIAPARISRLSLRLALAVAFAAGFSAALWLLCPFIR